MTAYGTTDPRGERSQVKLGRYEVVRELGKGAMGIVYLAKDPLIGRLVALKTIRPAAHADDEETKEFQQRFLREAQAAGILNHPAIVTVYEFSQDEASAMTFIAMEYVEGQNLKEALTQGRPLNFEQIGDVVAQVAEALDFAHSKGIVHRDVKPANIILLDGLRAKITDFGIAKIASGGGANLTSTGQFLGTPNYMAPEQIKGAPVDGRTDIFSLGICLYECLTRRKPFGGDSLTSISYKIVHEPFPPLQEINPQIPEGYTDVVTMCLAKDPAKRYQRGRDMAAAIRAVIRGERPVRPEPMLEDITIVTRADHDKIPTMEIPFPEAVSGTATSMAAAVAAAAPSVVMPGQATIPPAPRPARPAPKAPGANPIWYRRIPPAIFLTVVLVLLAGLVGVVYAMRSKQVPARVVDTKAEARHAKERRLRNEGNALIAQGKTEDAYAKFVELQKIAPNSPANNELVRKLDAIRTQNQATRAQLEQAKTKFDEGVSLLNQKKYADATKAFEESFHLNPNSEDTARYLKLSQSGEEIERREKLQKLYQQQQVAVTQTSGQRPPVTTMATGHPTTTTSPVAAAPARLTTVVNANVTDGYVLVKAGAQVLAYEQLWEETGRAFWKKRVPKPVNVTKELTPTNTDLDIWFVVKNLDVSDHKSFRQNFQPGAAHTLTITFDPASKRIDYHIN